jgi:hypothetical protein
MGRVKPILDFYGEARCPRPTDAPPASEERVREMAKRAARGEDLFTKADASLDDHLAYIPGHANATHNRGKLVHLGADGIEIIEHQARRPAPKRWRNKAAMRRKNENRRTPKIRERERLRMREKRAIERKQRGINDRIRHVSCADYDAATTVVIMPPCVEVEVSPQEFYMNCLTKLEDQIASYRRKLETAERLKEMVREDPTILDVFSNGHGNGETRSAIPTTKIKPHRKTAHTATGDTRAVRGGPIAKAHFAKVAEYLESREPQTIAAIAENTGLKVTTIQQLFHTTHAACVVSADDPSHGRRKLWSLKSGWREMVG